MSKKIMIILLSLFLFGCNTKNINQMTLKEIINESIKNSNLNFTKIEDSEEEYETYFSIIDAENKGESGEYDSIFIKK